MVFPNNIKTIILGNTAEAFLTIINNIIDSDDRRNRINIENSLSQRAYFWEGDDKIVITLTQIPYKLLSINNTLLGYQNVVNISPKYVSNSLCNNIRKDYIFLKNLIDCIRRNPNVKISAYSYTKELHALLLLLKSKNLKFVFSDQPLSNFSIVRLLDSKTGFRQVLSKIKGVNLPSGDICVDQDELRAKIANLKRNKSKYVAKANEGESGWGLFIGKDSDFNGVDSFIDRLRTDSIWKNGPYVVEEYIDINTARGGGSPSSELYISDEDVKITYNCAQIFDKEGEFSGIALGRVAIDDDLQIQMEKMASVIGRQYQALGYRGFCDVDFAISNDNKLYALETNVRRTGGTHVFDLAKRLFGSAWTNHLLYSNDAFNYGKETLSVTEILERTKDLLYPINYKNEGIIVSLIDSKRPIIGYIVVGVNKQNVSELQQRLIDIFRVA